MANINTTTAAAMVELGFTEDDALIFIRTRDRIGPFETLNAALQADMSDAGLRLLRTLIADGALDFEDDDGHGDGEGEPPRNGFEIVLLPSPRIEDMPSGAWKIAWTEFDGVDGAAEGPLPFGGPTAVARQTADLGEQIFLALTDPNGQRLREITFSTAEIATRQEGDFFRAEIPFRTLPLILEERFRMQRAGRYVVPSRPLQRFDGYRLAAAPLRTADTSRVQALFGQEGDLVTAARPVDVEDAAIAQALAGFPLAEASFDFDGSFSVEQPLEAGSEEHDGWIWLLAGRQVFFGVQRDIALASARENVTILLPTFALEADPAPPVPLDVGEQALLNRPDVFADDPGIHCRPFDNPGRILGERRFFTVLRVSEPELGQPESLQRRPVSRRNEIEWEGVPERFQARSVSIGHIVEFRVRSRSNGYSLGRAVHSMTLAPRQTRRIVRVDFERREAARRSEQTVALDQVEQATVSERTYSDAVRSELSEWSRGGSEAAVTAGAGGLGLAVGSFVIGGGAAHSSSSGSSWERGGRSVSAAEQQNLRDAIRQYGDSLRQLQSSVVTEVAQEEVVEGVSEVVRNINYCHALSVVYYEILRHLRIDTEVGGVRECLFVPLEIRPFTDTRIRLHRRVLSRYLSSHDQRLALRYLDDILANFVGSDTPAGTRASQELTTLTGSVYLRMGITRPTEGDIAEVEEGATLELSQTKRFKELVKALTPFAQIIGKAPTNLALTMLSLDEKDRDAYFQREIAPHMARAFADRMRIGVQSGANFQQLDADLTMATRYRYDGVVRVDFRIHPHGLRRDQTTQLVFRAPPAGVYTLPERSFADVIRGHINFTTEYYRRRVRSSGSVRDDLVDPLTGDPTADGGRLDLPLSSYEEESFRDRLREGLEELREELSDNLYRYHKVIWWNLDPDELYTLLDGFTVSPSDNRAIASVVERRPIGILGNCLVFRTAAGSGVDPNFESPAELLSYYRDGVPQSDPIRVSLPTSGLYARAHMDDCNACEEHQGSRDWVLSDPDPELADLPATLLGSRRAAPEGLAPTSFPETLINLQNAPAAPAPTGLGGALQAVTSADSFRDMVGLQGTQALAGQGLTTAANLASAFGANATNLRLAELEADKTAGQKLSSAADAAQRAVQKGQMTEADAQSFVRDFANRLASGAAGTGGGAGGGAASLGKEARDLAATLGPKGAGTLVQSGRDGTSVASFDASGLLAQAGGDGLSFDPNDPVYQALAKPALRQKSSEWAAERGAESAQRRLAIEAATGAEYAAWGDNPADLDGSRITEVSARPGSGHSRQPDLLNRLETYSRAARPSRGHSFHMNRALDYAFGRKVWSAAFVSRVYTAAGLGLAQGFRVSAGHSQYVLEALANRLNRDHARPFWLFRNTEVPVAVGDIICKARVGDTLDFNETLLSLSGDKPRIRFRGGEWSWGGGEFKSHADIVHSFEEAPDGTRFVFTVGGNTQHLDNTVSTVGKKKYRLAANGSVEEEVRSALHPDVVAGTAAENSTHPNNTVWAVIKMLDLEDFEEWQRIYSDYLDAVDPDDFRIDTFSELFGTPNADGDNELSAATVAFLQAGGRGRAIFRESTAADFSDVDRTILFKPIPQLLPPNVA